MSTTNKIKNRFLPIPENVLQNLEPEPQITDFEIIKIIGSGSFGKVKLAQHKKTKVKYAIKEIDKQKTNNKDGKPYFRREIEIMYKVNHPNIVKLYSHFEDEKYCYFLMEYVQKGTLFQEIGQTENYEPKKKATLMKELICAIYYLHNMNPPIVHRDIKPENVLIDKNGHVKLTDFGWSNYINNKEIRSTYCGTPVYLAPEMITLIGHDQHLDIWCIGVLMFELLTGEVPFKGKDLKSLSGNILSLNILWPRDINPEAKNLIGKILKPEPKERLSLEEMLKHPFFTKHLNNPVNSLMKPTIIKSKPFVVSTDVPEEIIFPIEDSLILAGNSNINMMNINTNTIASDISNVNKHEQIQHQHVSSNTNNNVHHHINTNNTTNNNEMNIITQQSNNELLSKGIGDDILNTNNSNNTNNIGISIGNSNNSSNILQPPSYDDININIKERYDKLLQNFVLLTVSYDELVLSTSEMNKKLEDSTQKESFMKEEKTYLLKEINTKDIQNLQLKAQNEEITQQLTQKEDKISYLTTELTSVSESLSKEKAKSLEYEKQLLYKEEEEKVLKKQISQLEKQLQLYSRGGISDDVIVVQSNNDIFSEQTKRLSVPIERTHLKTKDDTYAVEQMEKEFKISKEFYLNEIEQLKEELAKEKERSMLKLKEKEEEIKKLEQAQISIIEEQKKKYQKCIGTYEKEILEKNKKIELLNHKLRKYELIAMQHKNNNK